MTGYDLGEALKIALEPVTKNLVEINRRLEESTGARRKTDERCMNCANCFDLEQVDPMKPYSGQGEGSFFCLEFDMEFLAPHYCAETFYCKDFVLRR